MAKAKVGLLIVLASSVGISSNYEGKGKAESEVATIEAQLKLEATDTSFWKRKRVSEGTRTPNHQIHSLALCQLSYAHPVWS